MLRIDLTLLATFRVVICRLVKVGTWSARSLTRLSGLLIDRKQHFTLLLNKRNLRLRLFYHIWISERLNFRRAWGKILSLFILFLENNWQVFVRRLSNFALLRLNFNSFGRYLILVKNLFNILLQIIALLSNISASTFLYNFTWNTSSSVYGHLNDLICAYLLLIIRFSKLKNCLILFRMR